MRTALSSSLWHYDVWKIKGGLVVVYILRYTFMSPLQDNMLWVYQIYCNVINATCEHEGFSVFNWKKTERKTFLFKSIKCRKNVILGWSGSKSNTFKLQTNNYVGPHLIAIQYSVK